MKTCCISKAASNPWRALMSDVVWFMGPVSGPGYWLMKSERPGLTKRHRDGRPDSDHRPPKFAWKSMDREWHFTRMPQGYTAMNWRNEVDERTGVTHGWSVLSVTDYTQDKRPNVMVAFAVHRPDVQEPEMRALAEERYPTIWKRLNVREKMWSKEELIR